MRKFVIIFIFISGCAADRGVVINENAYSDRFSPQFSYNSSFNNCFGIQGIWPETVDNAVSIQTVKLLGNDDFYFFEIQTLGNLQDLFNKYGNGLIFQILWLPEDYTIFTAERCTEAILLKDSAIEIYLNLNPEGLFINGAMISPREEIARLETSVVGKVVLIKIPKKYFAGKTGGNIWNEAKPESFQWIVYSRVAISPVTALPGKVKGLFYAPIIQELDYNKKVHSTFISETLILNKAKNNPKKDGK
jgi:hypothetical protein